MQRGHEWAGDRDVQLTALRVGLCKTLPQGVAKKRIRKGLLRKLLETAVQTERLQLGAAFCLAYVIIRFARTKRALEAGLSRAMVF